MPVRLAVVALVMVAVGPLLTRVGLVRFPVGLALVAVGTLTAGAALVGTAVAAVRGGWSGQAMSVVLAVAALAVPAIQLMSSGRAPAIHDITTDTSEPPQFAALLPLRGEGASPSAYDGPEAADAQRRAYPDLVPLPLAVSPAEAMTRAARAARSLGWTIVESNPLEGRLEATSTTFWFRFTDDIVVRIRPVQTGSTVDVRSKSRVGRGDLGANARRIRAFLALMGVEP